MADNKANELNNRLTSVTERVKGSKINVSPSGNIRAIKDLILRCYERGIISVYRALTELEKAELAKNELDEITNAYYAEMDGRGYYITYKPQIAGAHNSKSKLEHINRSTPFTEALLTKISSQYSFLYCKSRVKKELIRDYGYPIAEKGFTVSGGQLKKEGSSNKYELFFLIECIDSIDGGENLFNIIDSVLLDVNANSGDFFDGLIYANLEREEAEDDDFIPEIDDLVVNQLNSIITEIRENSDSRGKILDFLAEQEKSAFHKFLHSRDSVHKMTGGAAAPLGNITCRVMPIGVFLNEVENYSLTYSVSKGNKGASFSYNISPTSVKFIHACPHCNTALNAGDKLVLVDEGGKLSVGCTACAHVCSYTGCDNYSFNTRKCSVCGKNFCSKHSHYFADGQSVCNSCGSIMRTSKGHVLPPSNAAVRANQENYISNLVLDIRNGGFSLNKLKVELKGLNILDKAECVKCLNPLSGKYYYYLKSETAACAACGEYFYKGDLVVSKRGEYLCSKHKAVCACGTIVNTVKAVKCKHDNCQHVFCDKCKVIDTDKLSFKAAIKALSNGNKSGFRIDGKIYCFNHVGICKICGKITPLEKLKTCEYCGGMYCDTCGSTSFCPTCEKARTVTKENYKQISTKSRMSNLNYLGMVDKFFGKFAAIEDKTSIVFTRVSGGAWQTYVYDKLENKFKVKR